MTEHRISTLDKLTAAVVLTRLRARLADRLISATARSIGGREYSARLADVLTRGLDGGRGRAPSMDPAWLRDALEQYR